MIYIDTMSLTTYEGKKIEFSSNEAIVQEMIETGNRKQGELNRGELE